MHERNGRLPLLAETESGLQVSSPISSLSADPLKEVSPLQKRAWLLGLALIGFLGSGCGVSITSYLKPEAPWGVIKRVAVLPFTLPSENPVQRELVTKLFCEELRNTRRVDVAEVQISSSLGSGVWDVKRVGKEYQADAVVSGSIDDTNGMTVHVQIHDVATEELLWSGTYLLGMQAEFFSLKTQQQKLQRGFRRLVKKFASASAVAPQSSPKKP